ncbi:MAG: hypothetical protein JOZ91_07110, partial [Candidatus Eremiobacteraeota bacterium]|nr:hypothetical protein [Candidatus Eremiobacteraeota bacterium]
MFIIALLAAATTLAACAAHSTPLLKHQIKEPLQCPCPTIAPLASYVLPGEAAALPNDYIGTIATGGDGNLWVPEFDANMIARVTPAGGIITEFPIPTPNTGPYVIALGPDGNMWFSEAIFNTIGRVTPSGTITEFAL